MIGSMHQRSCSFPSTMSRFYLLLLMKYVLSSMCLSQASTYLDPKQSPLSNSNIGIDQKYPASLWQSSFSDIYMKSHRAQSDEVFDIVFVTHERSIEEGPSSKRHISNPSYSGQAVSLLRENVESARDNLESSGGAVSYLILNGATITSDWQNCEYISAEAPISVWEKIFHCEFYSFLRSDSYGNDIKVTRTEKYRIPEELIPHVKSILSTVRELPNTPSVLIGGLRTYLSPIVMEDAEHDGRRGKSRYPNSAPTPSVSGDREGTDYPNSKPHRKDKPSSYYEPSPIQPLPIQKPGPDENKDTTESPTSSPLSIYPSTPSRSPMWRKKKVPTSSPNSLPLVYAMVTQALSGVTSQQALNMSFSVALMSALSSELGYPVNVDSVAQIGKRRVLLSSISIAYCISSSSLQATDGWISKVQTSVASPNFMTSLRNITGYPDITVLQTDVINISPTSGPTLSPINTVADTATLILAVGGALIGALVVGVSICVIYCCCYRVNKYTNPATLPEMPSAHPPMAEAVLAQSSLSNPTSTRSMTGYPVALPTPVARGVVQNVYVLQDVENHHDPTLPLYINTEA